MRKHGFWYRFAVISVVYVFFAAVVLASLSSSGVLPTWAFWTVFGVLVGLYIIVEVGNELLIYFRKQKKADDENNRS